MSYCPHCGKFVQRGRTSFSVNEYPYPYRREEVVQHPTKMIKTINKTLVQSINKIICGICGEMFFEQTRLGTDMGGDNQYYFQVYKSGQYRYRDFSTPLIMPSQGVLR